MYDRLKMLWESVIVMSRIVSVRRPSTVQSLPFSFLRRLISRFFSSSFNLVAVADTHTLVVIRDALYDHDLLKVPGLNIYFLSNPDDVTRVLTTCKRPDTAADYFREVLGDAPILSSIDASFRERRQRFQRKSLGVSLKPEDFAIDPSQVYGSQDFATLTLQQLVRMWTIFNGASQTVGLPSRQLNQDYLHFYELIGTGDTPAAKQAAVPWKEGLAQYLVETQAASSLEEAAHWLHDDAEVYAAIPNVMLVFVWALHLLAEYPEEQELFYAILQEEEGSEAEETALRELLRLITSLRFLQREAREEMEFGGVMLPVGSRLFVSPIIQQTHPRYWKDPYKFSIRRALDHADDFGRKGLYLPFGLGPHGCVAEGFSRRLLSVLFRSVITRFTVSSPDFITEQLISNPKPGLCQIKTPMPGNASRLIFQPR